MTIYLMTVHCHTFWCICYAALLTATVSDEKELHFVWLQIAKWKAWCNDAARLPGGTGQGVVEGRLLPQGPGTQVCT